MTDPTSAEAERLPGVVRGLSVVSGLNDTASEMVYPLLPALLTTTLGAPAAALGALDGAAELTASLVRLVSGRLAQRGALRTPLVLGGYALATLVRPLMAIAPSAGAVIGLRVTDRLGKGLRSPARDAMMADAVPPSMRGRAFGYHRAFDHGGAVLGGLLAWLLVARGMSPRAVIGWSVVPGMLVLAVLAMTLGKSRVVRREAGEGGATTAAAAATGIRFWVPVLALTLLVISRLPDALLILHLLRGGVALAMVPLAWAGLHVVRSAVAYPAGRMIDRLGERWVMTLSGVFAAAGAWAYGHATGTTGLVGTFLLLGVVTGLGEPAEKSLIARLAPKRAAVAFGKAQAVTGLGALLAGVGYGTIVDREGSGFALTIAAVAGVLATAAWVFASAREGR